MAQDATSKRPWMQLHPDRPGAFLHAMFGSGWVPIRSLTPILIPFPERGKTNCYLIDVVRLDRIKHRSLARLLAELRDLDMRQAMAILRHGFPVPVNRVFATTESVDMPLAQTSLASSTN